MGTLIGYFMAALNSSRTVETVRAGATTTSRAAK